MKKNDFVCPECKGSLRKNTIKRQTFFSCRKCDLEYPTLANQIPILLQDFNGALLETYVELSRIQADIEQKICHLDSAIDFGSERSKVLRKIKTSLAQNIEYFAKIKREVYPHLDLEATLDYFAKQRSASDSKSTAPYMDPIGHLKRDWSDDPEAKKEVDQILNITRSFLRKFPARNKKALALGAGTGRFALELTREFLSVCAIDLSIPMAIAYLKAFTKTSYPYDISYRNVIDANRSFQRIIPHLPSYLAGKQIHYAVANAKRIPLPVDTVDFISSIFFTDIMPFELLLKETSRILRKGGCLFHLGPLHYHFEDPVLSLSVNELRQKLETNGFQIVNEEFLPMLHFTSSNSLAARYYKNWAFLAQKI